MFEPVDSTSKTMDDLVKFLFFELKENNKPISETQMQKLIFKIKMELGENHELYEELPYYWYIHGPFSEVVRDSFNDIKNNFCELHTYNKVILKNQHDYFKDCGLVDNFSEIVKISKDIIHNQNLFDNIVKHVYDRYAPYRVMLPFKFKIYQTANDNRFSQNFDVDKYVDTFYECESQLPSDNYFVNFSEIYSQLCINLDLINDNGTFDENWRFLRNLIKELWTTFAKGLRVKSKDNYYNYETDVWDQKFEDNLRILSQFVDKTEILTNYNIQSNNYYTSSQKKILNTTIGSYLRG